MYSCVQVRVEHSNINLSMALSHKSLLLYLGRLSNWSSESAKYSTFLSFSKKMLKPDRAKWNVLYEVVIVFPVAVKMPKRRGIEGHRKAADVGAFLGDA